MPDLDAALDQLCRFAGSSPAHEPDLSRVIARAAARRRRRRATLGGVLAAVVAGSALLAVNRESDQPAHLRTADNPAPERRTTKHAALPKGSLISGQFGIRRVETLSLSLVYDQPTALAFNIGDDLVLAQGAEEGTDAYPPLATGPVLVLEGEGVREITPRAGEALRLHDAGVLNGRPVALVTARRGATPDDTVEELLLIDPESGDRTSLGAVGGWESGLQQASFADSRIATLLGGEGQIFPIVRSASDGTVVWEAPESAVGATVSMTVVEGDLVLLHPRFEGDDFEPHLGISRYDLETGEPASTDTITLEPTSGLAVAGGFCSYAEAASGSLFCDQSSGAPIEIDLVTGRTRPVTGVDGGRVTLPRGSAPTTPSGGDPCPGSVIRRVDGGDPQADALPPLTDAATDAAVAQAELDRRRDELLERYDALSVDLGPGFGRAWAGVNGGRFAEVDVDDYGILVALRRPADCPVGEALHQALDRVPLFFFIGEPVDRPAVPASDRTISAAHRNAIDAFIRFAHEPSEATAAAVTFGEVVGIGLGGDLLRDLDAVERADRLSWKLPLDNRWGRDGSASALDLLGTTPSLGLTRDRIDSCASEAGPGPASMASLTRLTLEPADIDTCLNWFAVDLFLDDGGAVVGVTVELWDP